MSGSGKKSVFSKLINDTTTDSGIYVFIFGVVMLIFVFNYLDLSQNSIVSLLFLFSPIWLPYLTFFLFFEKWMDTVGLSFYTDNGRTTLEIALPPEVFKSPEAMETVINQIHNVANPDNLMQTYLDGKKPLPYSLELVSKGGTVNFYANLPSKKTTQTFIQTLYSQYPGVEIKELDLDYVAEIPGDLKGYEMMAFHMGKKKDQALPIRTFRDYKMDTFPKEEEKTDPITTVLENLANLKPYEQVWIQILFTPHREKSFKNGQLKSAPTWEGEAKLQIDKLMNRDPKTKKASGMDDDDNGMSILSPGERRKIEAIEDNMAHYAYETAIRWLYIVEEGKFEGDTIPKTIRSFSTFDNVDRNSVGVRWRTDFDYKFLSDPLGSKVKVWKKEELHLYKMRIYAPRSGIDTPKIFTAQEIATMWHLPGTVAKTPTLNRVTSTRSEAPSNLPI